MALTIVPPPAQAPSSPRSFDGKVVEFPPERSGLAAVYAYLDIAQKHLMAADEGLRELEALVVRAEMRLAARSVLRGMPYTAPRPVLVKG